MPQPLRPVFQFALDGYETRTPRPMGRQHAGSTFLRAAVDGREGPVAGMGIGPAKAAEFAQAIAAIDADAPVEWLGSHEVERLCAYDVLHLLGPGLGTIAGWRSRLGAAAFSVSGVTHTIASERVMTELAALPTSLAMPWDALICTSGAVRAAVELILERQEDMLRRRLGASRFPRPMLPVIPLGVHAADFAPSPGARETARRALGIAPDEVVACFLGRLSFHAKAHPAAMYEGLQEASRRSGKRIVLVETGWFANDLIAAAFAQGRRDLCPDVRCLVTDGRPPEGRAQALAAADLFISLSDNIQETFGLTPLEAMAAGLPVVVTDWDGYRETVRDGLDGFRIPTLAPPPGAGEAIAARFERETVSYDQFCGMSCLSVAVDTGILADRLHALVADPELRRRMGQAGQAHVRGSFDWRVVYGRYRELWQECRALRLRAAAEPRAELFAPAWALDPFTLFSSYPTAQLTPATRLRLLPAATAWQARLASPLFAFATSLFPEAVRAAGLIMASLASHPDDTLLEMSQRVGAPLAEIMLGAGLLAKMNVAAPAPPVAAVSAG